MVIKNQHIPLTVKAVSPQSLGHYLVTFDRPVGFEYEAGDWIDIDFSPTTLTGGITYSLASSPTEPDLAIVFKEGLSGVKKTLQNAKTGDKFHISQYGNDYGFTVGQTGSSVLIAGGVGIAPFRSMVCRMYDRRDGNAVDLLYMNKDDNFLFAEELASWQSKLSGLNVNYIVTKDLNRKKREKLLLSYATDSRRNYYIAGPPAMVESVEHLLIDNGIPIKNIRVDIFGGY